MHITVHIYFIINTAIVSSKSKGWRRTAGRAAFIDGEPG